MKGDCCARGYLVGEDDVICEQHGAAGAVAPEVEKARQDGIVIPLVLRMLLSRPRHVCLQRINDVAMKEC